MPAKSSISMTTRVSDLDSLRHVNSKTYEHFCLEGRYRILEEHGYPIESLLDKDIALHPVASYVRFSLQQKQGATLNTQTEGFASGDGTILWSHQISQQDGKTVCRLQVRTKTLERRHRSKDLLPVTGEDPQPLLIETVPDFSGSCSRLLSSYTALYTDMDPFGLLSVSALWRIYEEGRFMFAEQLGLTPEKLVQLDTHLFWVAATYQFYRPIKAGVTVRIYTWLERIQRIRAYIRQEVRAAAGDELLSASREEHLIASLKEARPKRFPPEFMEVVQDYIEYRD